MVPPSGARRQTSRRILQTCSGQEDPRTEHGEMLDLLPQLQDFFPGADDLLAVARYCLLHEPEDLFRRRRQPLADQQPELLRPQHDGRATRDTETWTDEENRPVPDSLWAELTKRQQRVSIISCLQIK